MNAAGPPPAQLVVGEQSEQVAGKTPPVPTQSANNHAEAIKRQESATALCKKVDVMFVLGGLHSANTRRLAELCKNHNSETFHLQNWDELDKKVLIGKNIAGVTAGASTPNWVIDEFVKHLEAFDEKR